MSDDPPLIDGHAHPIFRGPTAAAAAREPFARYFTEAQDAENVDSEPHQEPASAEDQPVASEQDSTAVVESTVDDVAQAEASVPEQGTAPADEHVEPPTGELASTEARA